MGETKQKWYRTSGGIIALLILFFPIGLYLMWKYAEWGKAAKWIITGVLAISFIATSANNNNAPTTTKTDTEPTQATTTNKETTPTPEVITPEPTNESKPPAVSAEYKSALNKATSYANTMNMSKRGVYDQLVSEYGEKFSAPAAQYAIDNVKADWNANALAKAKTYQDDMNMSPSAIHDQLTSEYGEKFTQAEADYAIQHL